MVTKQQLEIDIAYLQYAFDEILTEANRLHSVAMEMRQTIADKDQHINTLRGMINRTDEES